jgi:hypothetical protein
VSHTASEDDEMRRLHEMSPETDVSTDPEGTDDVTIIQIDSDADD